MEKIRVTTIEQFREIFDSETISHDFFISLGGGLCKSSKVIERLNKSADFSKEMYLVENFIDDSVFKISLADINNELRTNIGKALKTGNLIYEKQQ